MRTVSFAKKTIERIRPSVTVERGQKIYDYDAPESELEIRGCVVDSISGSEDRVNREARMTQWQVMAPPGADIMKFDKIRYRGREYRISGSLQEQESPTGRLDHLYFIMQDWEG